MLLFFVSITTAQDELLNQLDSLNTKEKSVTPYAFKGLQVCNMQSTKLPAKGEWYVLWGRYQWF
jgi:hypothetical protein